MRRAEKAGRIRREADGVWNLAGVKVAWAGNTDPARAANEVLKAQERRLRRLVERRAAALTPRGRPGGTSA